MDGPRRVVRSAAGAPPRGPRFFEELDRALAIALPRAVDEATCAAWVLGVERARAAWVADWGGEQYSLGRAFYTHLEQGRARDYFAGAAASDAAVERALPGMQARVVALLGDLVGGVARPRRGWCGPGVHVFPPGQPVAEHGGVVHVDHEGLTDHHRAHRKRALSLVVMVQPPREGGGLRLWDVVTGDDAAIEDDVGDPDAVARLGAGDAIAFDSYRLHQIEPFSGPIARVSITAHAAEVDPGLWEVWF